MNRLVLEADVVAILCASIEKGTLGPTEVRRAVEFIDALCGDARLDAPWDYTRPSVPTLIGLVPTADPSTTTRALEYLSAVCQRCPDSVDAIFAADVAGTLAAPLRYVVPPLA
jgi:hypothetical protein